MLCGALSEKLTFQGDMDMNFMSEGSLMDRIFSFLGKMVALNVLWMVCCLPVVTAGASTTALFYCMLKLHKDGDICTFRDFFKSFQLNFRQSTAIWVGLLLLAAVFYMEKNAVAAMPGELSQVFGYVLAAVCIPLVLTALYVFPTVAAFENSIKKLVTNAFYFALKKPGYAIAAAVITLLPMGMTLVDAGLFPVYLFLWLLFGFSLTAYADSWFFWKLFRPYFPEEGTDENPNDEMNNCEDNL